MLAVADLKGNHSIHAEAVYTFGKTICSSISCVILPTVDTLLSYLSSVFKIFFRKCVVVRALTRSQANPASAIKPSPCTSTI